MDKPEAVLHITFDDTIDDRDNFLQSIRNPVMGFTKEKMRLDALIKEIAKNIYDHANGRGSLAIAKKANVFEFYIKDEGTESFDIESCKKDRQPTKNGINFGIGLGLIKDLAEALDIDLIVDTSKGFCYKGTYTSKKS